MKSMWRCRKKLEKCSYKARTPRIAVNHQQLGGGAWNRFSLKSLQNEKNPADILKWVSGLLNCESIYFSYFKEPSVWKLVRVIIGNKHNYFFLPHFTLALKQWCLTGLHFIPNSNLTSGTLHLFSSLCPKATARTDSFIANMSLLILR